VGAEHHGGLADPRNGSWPAQWGGADRPPASRPVPEAGQPRQDLTTKGQFLWNSSRAAKTRAGRQEGCGITRSGLNQADWSRRRSRRRRRRGVLQ